MAQLVPIAALVGAGATLYGVARQSKVQQAQQAVQVSNAAAEAEARAATLAAQQAADARARAARLAGTTASARARLAAGGVAPDDGSAVALTSGLAREAGAAQSETDAAFAARLAAGRRSLLNDDGSLTPWLRAGAGFGTSLRNLLE